MSAAAPAQGLNRLLPLVKWLPGDPRNIVSSARRRCRQDAGKAAERAEIVHAAIDEPSVREPRSEPSLELSSQRASLRGSTSLTLRPSLRCDRTPAPGARG